jgi:hypothetical protein
VVGFAARTKIILKEKSTIWQRFLDVVVQYFFAIVFSQLVMIPLELSARNEMDILFPGTAVVAFLAGVFLSNRIRHGRGGLWVWIIGTFWMAFGIYGLAESWSPTWSSQPTRWEYARANLLGPDCHSTECLGTVINTAPFIASICYSLGVGLRKVFWGSNRIGQSP